MSEEINTNLLSKKKKSATWPLVSRLVKSYLRPYMGQLTVAILLMVLAAAMTAAFAAMVQPVMDDVLIAGRQGRILALSVVIMVLFVVRGGATYFHTITMNTIGQSIVADTQKDLFAHFMELDLRFFHDHPSGELLSRVVNDVSVMRMAVTEVLTSVGKSFLTFIFLAGVMFYQDWKLALAAFTIFPVAGLFVVWIGRRLRKQSGKIQTGIADLSDHLSQIFQGVRLVKAYGMETHETERANKKISKLRDTVIKTEQIANLSTPVNEFLAGLILFGILMYGGWQVADGNTTAGALMSFITAFIMSYEPLKRLAKLNNKLQMGLGAAERVFDILDTKATITDHPVEHTSKLQAPLIRFENVEFQYLDDEIKALDGVSFDIPGGKVTALVGASGSGKTTIMNMIPRFFDVNAGRIVIDGKEIRDYSLVDLRSQIALVSQDITIFDDTALANIAYGRAGASYEEVVAAAKAAEAHDFIKSLPDGYETRLGEEGLRLSGGQRQRISIARAILRDAPILLLDEATSALDNESERAIQSTLAQFQKGRTTLVIAHRLSTVQNADQILVLDRGQVAERGHHEELVKAGGLYARMYNAGFNE